MEENLADILLDKSQKLWLETLSAKTEAHEEIDYRNVRVELGDLLPKDFDTSRISNALLKDKTDITLLGIGLVKPENPIVKATDKVIQSIQKILNESPKTEEITAQQISELTDIRIGAVEEILEKLSKVDLFHNSGLGTSKGWSSINIDERAFENYRKYKTIAEWLKYLKTKIYYQIPFNLELPAAIPNLEIPKSMQPQTSKRVFVVHGQDNEAKESVARFISKLNLELVILHEQTSGGKTIIEKFEHHSTDVAFAVVLLTPDDLGSNKNNAADLQPRARQNVIFELGYFFAKLKRERVCALYKDIELPSDIHGVVYVSMDSGGAWKYQLAKEMKQAGLDIDMNKI